MPDLTFLHPMVVHFPIALLLVGFVLDLIGLLFKKDLLLRTGFILLLLGTAGTAVAYFSGERAGDGLAEAGALKQALENHEEAATLSLWLAGLACAVRVLLVATQKMGGNLRWVPAILFGAAALSIVRTGHFGGTLVYNHAAGVQLTTVLESLAPADSAAVPEAESPRSDPD